MENNPSYQDIDPTTADKLRDISRRMGELIACVELAEEKMTAWKDDIRKTMDESQQSINVQLDDVRATAEELRVTVTDANMGKLKVVAESTLKQGQDHLRTLDAVSQKQIQKMDACTENFNALAKQSFERLDRASTYTIKNISEAISSFRIGDFEQLTEQSRERVEDTSQRAISSMQEISHWFHWKNIGMVFAITVFVSLTIGLYLEDEMPWEIHQQVMLERNAGKTLMKAWPVLSQAERETILKQNNKSIG